MSSQRLVKVCEGKEPKPTKYLGYLQWDMGWGTWTKLTLSEAGQAANRNRSAGPGSEITRCKAAKASTSPSIDSVKWLALT